MGRTSSIGTRSAGIAAVPPKRGAAPRQTPLPQTDDDDDDDAPHNPPPPGMGKLVDKSV
jgi:hypothetical protein